MHIYLCIYIFDTYVYLFLKMSHPYNIARKQQWHRHRDVSDIVLQMYDKNVIYPEIKPSVVFLS